MLLPKRLIAQFAHMLATDNDWSIALRVKDREGAVLGCHEPLRNQ